MDFLTLAEIVGQYYQWIRRLGTDLLTVLSVESSEDIDDLIATGTISRDTIPMILRFIQDVWEYGDEQLEGCYDVYMQYARS